MIGDSDGYLHISKEINYESESMNGHALECLKNWKADILKFYNDLSVTYDSFVGNEVTLKRLLDLMKNNTKTIGINREEYKKKYSELKKMCNDALEDIGSDNFRNEQMIKYTLGDFINYLDRKLYVTQVSEEVEIYEYETGKSYCTGSDVFTAIVGQNTMCIYCLQTTDEEYYETGKTGTISELSKKISMVEEDLNYFAKHVFLYTNKMKQFAVQHIGNFEKLCEEYLTKERFEDYKNDIQNSYEYDFIINLFIKFPFLNFEKYYMRNQKELQYRSVTSFVQEKFNDNEINLDKVREDMEILETILDDEDALFKWLDQQIELD